MTQEHHGPDPGYNVCAGRRLLPLRRPAHFSRAVVRGRGGKWLGRVESRPSGSVSDRAIELVWQTRLSSRSRRFQNAECDNATGKETMAAGVGWNVPATA